MGHAVTFFDNDFAGRIAQKADADRPRGHRCRLGIRERHRLRAGLGDRLGGVSGFGRSLGRWRCCWAGCYPADPFFMPRIRCYSAGCASAAPWSRGQVVDTITNIKTVKLFAHAEYETAPPLAPWLIPRPRAGVRPRQHMVPADADHRRRRAAGDPCRRLDPALAAWQASAGDIAAAGAIAMRLS